MRCFPIATIVEGGPGSGNHAHQGLRGVWGGSSRRGGRRGLDIDSSGQIQLPFPKGSSRRLKVLGDLALRRRFKKDVEKSPTHKVLKVLNTGIHETAKVEITAPGGRKYEACRKRTQVHNMRNSLTVEAVSLIMGSDQLPSTLMVEKTRPEGDPLGTPGSEVVFLFSKWMAGTDFHFTTDQQRMAVPYSEYEKMVILDIVTMQRDRHGKNFNLDARGKINLTDNDFIMGESAARSWSERDWRRVGNFDLFGSDVFTGTVRREEVGKMLNGKKISAEGRAMLNRLTSTTGQKRLLRELTDIHGGDAPLAEIYVKAFVNRARALGRKGKFNYLYCT
jgi:hypothetical protein